MERPNLILISLDTLRAKSVSAYGSPRNTMPMLDSRLAAAGALVRTAVTPFPYTPPSHMSMLTGLDVCAHGVEDRHGVLAPDVLTLAESLRASGYRTAAFTENGYVVAGAGFARGFDSYFELLSEERASPGFASETFGRAARFLEDVDTRPFFLFVHTYQVHGPYTPPRGFQTLFDDGPLPGYDEANGRSLDDYEREIRYTDELLGGFLDALDARGLAERSIVVVTSDHGEEFGEHFFTGHGFDVYDEALLVPMVLRAPGLIAPGRVVEPQVGLMDLPPTLLDLMGLPPLADIQGQSFAGLLRGSPQAGGAPFAERPLVSKASHSRSLRTRAYKYIEGTAKSRWQKLYALGPDPDEKQNVAAGHPDWIAEAEASMAAHEAACQAWRERHPSSGAGSGEAHERPGWMINRDEIERKLRSLGYVE
jgi:arylsulfatase A-like enzyme